MRQMALARTLQCVEQPRGRPGVGRQSEALLLLDAPPPRVPAHRGCRRSRRHRTRPAVELALQLPSSAPAVQPRFGIAIGRRSARRRAASRNRPPSSRRSATGSTPGKRGSSDRRGNAGPFRPMRQQQAGLVIARRQVAAASPLTPRACHSETGSALCRPASVPFPSRTGTFTSISHGSFARQPSDCRKFAAVMIASGADVFSLICAVAVAVAALGQVVVRQAPGPGRSRRPRRR